MTARTDLQYLTGVFAGEDGGATFIYLQVLVEDMEARALTGDAAAAEVLLVMSRFVRLVKLAALGGPRHDA